MSTYGQSAAQRPPRLHAWPWLVFLAALGVFIWRMWLHEAPLHNPDATPRPVTARGKLADDELSTIEIYKRAKQSVVHITSFGIGRDFFTLDVTKIPRGTGSGFIWDEHGHVVTNQHVIRGAASAQVTLADGSSYGARLVGQAQERDLAVLSIDVSKDKAPPLQIGISSDLQVGQKVFAIGNPFGLDQTLTTGIISALGRELSDRDGTSLQGLIQTDAAINPGNSGGPLLDSSGLLIGVNTAIISPTQSYAGVGFAIPVDEVNYVVTELIRSGELARPQLDVRLVADRVASPFFRRHGYEPGALVLEVIPESPAARAGLRGTRLDADGNVKQLGDIIVAVDEKRVKSAAELLASLARYRVGNKVKVTVVRDGEKKTFEVTLSAG